MNKDRFTSTGKTIIAIGVAILVTIVLWNMGHSHNQPSSDNPPIDYCYQGGTCGP